ncbi:MAG TPA: hypothetical protein VKJ67_09760 [Methylomirabilota bacterium]|nr:hypothetical protein [Methylomirabilota bacterium]
MIRMTFLFLSTGISLLVAVALIVGIAWLAVAVPVLIATGAGYGVVALRRHGSRGSAANR